MKAIIQCYTPEEIERIARGELVEVPKGAAVLTPEERDEEMRPCNEERKQLEHRAEVAERALEYAVDDLNFCCDDCPCGVCTAEIRGSQECLDCIANVFKKYAEREIKEERK